MSGIYRDVDLSELENASPTQDGALSQGGAEPVAAEQPAEDDTAPIPGAGPLLEEPDPSKVFKAVHGRVLAQERLAKNRAAAAKHWARVRRGVPFSMLVKSEDRAEWRAELPPGVDDTAQPIPNKADDLCSKIVAQVVVDPFRPDPKPQTDSEESRGAADLAKKFLTADGDESGTNDNDVLRATLTIAQTHASGFAHQWVDPQGNGWRPLQIKAHPQAIDATNPLIGPDGMPSADYVLRYVTEQGQFTENPAEAGRQWLPKVCVDVLSSANVRTIPETEPVATASTVILLMCRPISDAKKRFPVLQTLSPAQLKDVADWRPPRAKVLVPEALAGRLRSQDASKDDAETVSDDALMFWYQQYCTSGSEYPDGAEVAVSGAGSGLVLKRAVLRDDLQQDDGGSVPLIRSVPVVQMLALRDADGGDPFGRRPIEKFGAANEARAQLYGGVLDDTDRRLHPNVFLTNQSQVQGWQLLQRTGDPLRVATKDDMPEYEQFAELPGFLPEILARIDADMDTAANLGETAQALESPDSVSGVAKQTVIAQAKVQLAELYAHAVLFMKRFWRVKTELVQAKYTVPQQVEFSGTDAAFKQRWWTGANLTGVGDIRLQPGSGTMMSPAEKQQYLGFAQSAGWIVPDEAAEVGRSTVSDDLGLEDNPHEALIARQIAAWMDGPPEEWVPSQPQVDPVTGQPAVDPMTGQPVMTPSWTPFEPHVTDDDPNVAPVRYKKLRQFIASTDYAKHPPEWRAVVDQVYQQARQASGIATVAEQQAAQAEAQRQQMEAEAGEKQADRENGAAEAEQDRAHQSAEADKQRQHEAQQGMMQTGAQMASRMMTSPQQSR